MEYLKLSQIKNFKVVSYEGVEYQKWDKVSKKMLKSVSKLDGYRVVYKVNVMTQEGKEGQVALSGERLGDMLLEYITPEGTSSIVDNYYNVWWNKKTLKEARYKIYKLNVKS